MNNKDRSNTLDQLDMLLDFSEIYMSRPSIDLVFCWPRYFQRGFQSPQTSQFLLSELLLPNLDIFIYQS